MTLPWLRAVIWMPLALALGGCPARMVTPVAMTQAGDQSLTCAQIDEQRAANRGAAQRFAEGEREARNRNAAAGVASVFIGWPALMAMDFTREEQIQLRALADRDARLEELRRERRCA